MRRTFVVSGDAVQIHLHELLSRDQARLQRSLNIINRCLDQLQMRCSVDTAFACKKRKS
jgi:hypothetical protein